LVVKSTIAACSTYKKSPTGYRWLSGSSRNPWGKLAEGVGFEPTVGNYPYSGLANRRTRPAMRPFRMKIAPLGAKGGTRTPTPLRAQRPERCVSTNSTTLAWVLSRDRRRDNSHSTPQVSPCQEWFGNGSGIVQGWSREAWSARRLPGVAPDSHHRHDIVNRG
jgi:hypothetical protein